MILTDTAVSGKFPENSQRIAACSPAIASIVIFLDPTYNFCNPNVTVQHLYSYFSITNDTASRGRTEVPWNIYLKHISPSESSPRTPSSPTTTAANSSSPSIPGSPREIWNSISSIFWRPTVPRPSTCGSGASTAIWNSVGKTTGSCLLSRNSRNHSSKM